MKRSTCERSECIATTEIEHASLVRTPANVENVYEEKPAFPPPPTGFLRAFASRTARPICVSHSEPTMNISVVTFLRRWHTERTGKVPPECERSSTIDSRNEYALAWHWKPSCGIGKRCPSCPSSLLAERVTILSLGKTSERSDANCSPTHRLASHPVISTSTEPSASPRS